MGYAAAGFTTFMTILGRYDLRNTKIDELLSAYPHFIDNQTLNIF